MIKHRVTFHPLLLLAALLFLPAYSTAGHVEDDVAFRVYYLFEPADEKQLQRAASAYRATLGRDGVEWIGIRRSTTTAVPFAPLALAEGPALLLTFRSSAGTVPGESAFCGDCRVGETLAIPLPAECFME
mgnify:CR=1 FL=1